MPVARRMLPLLAILLLATGLRAAWVVQAEMTPVPLMDTFFYDQTARRLATGLGFTNADGTPTALFPPAYPVMLAGVYRLFGAGVGVAQGLNVALSAGIVLLTYAVGRLTVGGRAALAGALIWAVFPSQIVWSSLLMSELLFTFTHLASLALALAATRSRSRRGRASLVAAAGATAGAALLIRGQALGLCVVIVTWLVLRRRVCDRWLLGPVFVLVVTVMVMPWTVRNARQLDALIPISTTVGWNAAIGHSEYATGGFWSPIDAGLFGEHYFTPEPAREVAFHRSGLGLAWSWAREHPRAELRLSVAKARLLWQSDDDAIAWQELGGAGRLGAWEHMYLPPIVNGFYYAVMLPAGVGLVAGLTRGRSWAPLVLALALAWTAFHIVFFAANRYHYPLLPLLALAAAGGLGVLGEMAASLRRTLLVAAGFRFKPALGRRPSV